MYLDSHVRAQCTRVFHMRDFHLHVNQQKMRVSGCAHAECVFLLAGIMCVSIKFKSSYTVRNKDGQLFSLCSVRP